MGDGPGYDYMYAKLSQERREESKKYAKVAAGIWHILYRQPGLRQAGDMDSRRYDKDKVYWGLYESYKWAETLCSKEDLQEAIGND